MRFTINSLLTFVEKVDIFKMKRFCGIVVIFVVVLTVTAVKAKYNFLKKFRYYLDLIWFRRIAPKYTKTLQKLVKRKLKLPIKISSICLMVFHRQPSRLNVCTRVSISKLDWYVYPVDQTSFFIHLHNHCNDI